MLVEAAMRRLFARILETGAVAALFLCLSWSVTGPDVAAAAAAGVVSVLVAAAGRGPERQAEGLRWRWLRPYRSLPWRIARDAVRVWGTLLRPGATGIWSREADPRARDPEAAHRALVVMAESTSASSVAVGLDPEDGTLVSHALPEGHGG